LVGLVNGVQPFAALTHQALAPRQAQVAIALQGVRQGLQTFHLLCRQAPIRTFAQMAGQKTAEAFLAALEIAKAPISLQLQ
jgi:hypothetical protein